MLSSDDRERWARAFAVSDEQIERDHLISHVLRAIAADEPAGLVFYGGTALSRTYLPDFRLSEDIAFLARPRQDVARQIEALLPPALRMDFGEISWDPSPSGVFRDTIPALLNAWNLQVKMQIIDLDHAQARWPTERREIALRYGDLPVTVELTVPTVDGFAAMKTAAWDDRASARDLADLDALARIGAIDESAIELFAIQAGRVVDPYMFDTARVPSEAAWRDELAHQMPEPPDRLECVERVRAIYGALLGWPT